MNQFMNAMKNETNIGVTENGAPKHLTTHSDLLDMFAMGGAYRNRSDDDVKLMMRKAYQENPTYALKCLFYLRDVRGGQGERRFFRVAMKDLTHYDIAAVRRLIPLVAEYGRYDDLYVFVGTPAEADAMKFIKNQLELDVTCKTPSLLAKWLKSENTSSAESRRLANVTRQYLGMSHKQYRKTLSILRQRINVLERLMSENRWDEIEFDKIPSKAGLKYKNAFARHDVERARAGKQTYSDFAKDETKTVNAEVLNPVDIAHQIFEADRWASGWNSRKTVSETDRLMWQKYWDNLKDYYNGREENGIAIVDTSGSMDGQPMDAAVSMGAYIAERGKGPFKNHFFTFSSHPHFVEFEGVDIYDKFVRAKRADWSGSTNIKAVFDMMLDTALKYHVPQSDMPQVLYIFSDMEFDNCIQFNTYNPYRSAYSSRGETEGKVNTLLESIAREWVRAGYEIPRVIFWNLDARTQNIPALGGRFSYVSGFSMNMVETIMSGKDGYDLMMEKLDSERYAPIK